MTGTQISNMDPSPTIPDGAVVPFVVPPATPGFDPGLNYIYDLGADLLTRVSYTALAAPNAAAFIGSADGDVQGDIDARPTAAVLAAPTGAGTLGTERSNVQDDLNSVLTQAIVLPTEFGGTWNGSTPDDVQFSDALNTLNSLAYPGGEVRFGIRQSALSDSYAMPDEININLGNSWLYASPSGDALFSHGWGVSGAANQIARPQVHGGNIRLSGASKTALRFQNCDSPIIRDTHIDLLAASQIGIHAKANEDPPAPYYGLIDGIRISGASNPVPGDGKTGLLLEGLPIPGSYGINRWLLSNIRLIGFVDYGMDVRGADGLVGSNINLEGCYEKGIRFGQGNRSITTPITALVGPYNNGAFRCAGLVGIDLDPGGTIIVNSGLNAGYSLPVVNMIPATGEVQFAYGLPFAFQVGDSITFTEAKARNITFDNVTYEGSAFNEDYVHFTAGARNCRVRTAFLTLHSGFAMRRDIEDPDCGIASEYVELYFEGPIPLGTGSVWLDASHIDSATGGWRTTGGGMWVDAISVSASVRTPDSHDGVITIQCYDSGIQDAIPEPVLTRIAPSYAIRSRKTLTAAQFLNPAVNIKILCNYVNLAQNERVRVMVRLGRIG